MNESLNINLFYFGRLKKNQLFSYKNQQTASQRNVFGIQYYLTFYHNACHIVGDICLYNKIPDFYLENTLMLNLAEQLLYDWLMEKQHNFFFNQKDSGSVTHMEKYTKTKQKKSNTIELCAFFY